MLDMILFLVIIIGKIKGFGRDAKGIQAKGINLFQILIFKGTDFFFFRCHGQSTCFRSKATDVGIDQEINFACGVGLISLGKNAFGHQAVLPYQVHEHIPLPAIINGLTKNVMEDAFIGGITR